MTLFVQPQLPCPQSWREIVAIVSMRLEVKMVAVNPLIRRHFLVLKTNSLHRDLMTLGQFSLCPLRIRNTVSFGRAVPSIFLDYAHFRRVPFLSGCLKRADIPHGPWIPQASKYVISTSLFEYLSSIYKCPVSFAFALSKGYLYSLASIRSSLL